MEDNFKNEFENNNGLYITYKKRNLFIIIITMALLFVMTTGFLAGYFLTGKVENKNKKDSNRFSDLEELENLFLEKFYKDVSRQELKKAYYDALFNIKNDRYTRLSELAYQMNSSGGYGIYVSGYNKNNIKGLMVTGILNKTLASENIKEDGDITRCLYPGDVIVGYYDKKENKNIYFKDINDFKDNLDNVFNKIKLSEEKKEIDIIVKNPHDNINLEKKITMRYEKYEKNNSVEYINYEKNKFPGINDCKKLSYLRIKEFSPEERKGGDDSHLRVQKALEEIDNFLSDSENNELLIDLRNNPGGELYSVFNILKLFIPHNGKHLDLFSLVPNALKKDPYKDMEIFSKYDGPNLDRKYKIKLLVNSRSASAAEVFASVMKEHCPNCEVYGSETFGKDLFQQTIIKSGLDSSVFQNGIAKATITAGKWGYYKKGYKGIQDLTFITDTNGKIINKNTDSYVKNNVQDDLFNSLGISKPSYKYDTVDVEKIGFLANFLMYYIKNNLDKFPEFSDPNSTEYKNLIDNTFLRTDGYFDLKIKSYLKKFTNQVGITPTETKYNIPDDEFTYFTYAKIYRYLLIRKTYSFQGSLLYENAIDNGYDRQLIDIIKK